jgi:hypothetical protein
MTVVQRRNGKFEQIGTATNCQGGFLSLCTCKHQMRAQHSCEEWVCEYWAAAFNGITTGGRRNDLVYLTKVKYAFPSQWELSMSPEIPADTKLAKAAHLNPLGDFFEPLPGAEFKDRFNPEAYSRPVAGHSHQVGWSNDIRKHVVFSEEMPPALLIGDPQYTFIWDEPLIEISGPRLGRWRNPPLRLCDFLAKLRSNE